MADYATLQQAINAGITNMTILRNNSKNDDGTTTYATGIDWFKFNGNIVSNIYSSGNSWIGFGTSNEQLKVNRRDCAVYYEYKETGVIGITKFFKFRWRGYAHYNTTGSTSLQEFEFFLLDTGQIFFRFITVPTTYFNGINNLTADTTVLYSVTAGTPCEYTFTPSDVVTGKGFSVSADRPNIDANYKSSGYAILTYTSYISGGNDTLYWTADTPTGTSVTMSASVNNGSWQNLTNGGVISGMTAGQTYNLRIRIQLSTTDTSVTPSVSQMYVITDDDQKIIVLGLNVPNITPAIGSAQISYDGLGALAGVGGPTEAFEGTFTPSGMTWKGNQNEYEHISMSMIATPILKAITYYDTQENEHVTMSMTATLTLINAHDL